MGKCSLSNRPGLLKVNAKANSIFRIRKFSFLLDLIEFKDYLLHKKRVPLLQNAILILCYERGGLIGWPRQSETVQSDLTGSSQCHCLLF